MFSRVISLRFTLISLICCMVLLTLAACGQSSNSTSSAGSSALPTPTPTTTLDEMGTPIVFPTNPPQRIVSLVPSTSEMLGALQLGSKVVGVDYYTNYPTSFAAIPRVSNESGNFNVEQIVALKPDLVLTYGGETKQYDTKLQQLNVHVVDLARSNFTQSLQEILLVGRLTFTEDTATKLVKQLQQQIDQVKASVSGTATPKVYLEVDDSTPGKPFVFGGTSFGDELAQDAHGSNIFHSNSTNGGYPQVTDETILSANPDYIILTEDPKYGGNVDAVYKRPNWSALAAVKSRHVYHINVDIIQRPGPRLVQGLRCVAQIVHPDKFAGALPTYCASS
jgi:iron complex transport system substrate-binding protein